LFYFRAIIRQGGILYKNKGIIMKKLLVLFLGCLVVVSIMSGCISNHVSKTSQQVEVRLVPDIVVGKQITGEAQITTLFGVFYWGASDFAECVDYTDGSAGDSSALSGLLGINPLKAAKAAAAYNACTANDADFIVTPRYSIKYDNYLVYSTAKAVVKGYKGTLKGVKVKK
jgi:hypothetical protein